MFHPVSPRNHHQKLKRQAPAQSCASGAFYVFPTAGSSVNASEPIDIKWDTSLNCLGPDMTQMDIHILAPALPPQDRRVQTLRRVDYTAGHFQTTLDPSWWGSKPNIDLQFVMTEVMQPHFFEVYGPTFKATSVAVAVGGISSDPALPGGATPSGSANPADNSGKVTVITSLYHPGGLSKGSIAAAVIVPILTVIAAIAIYVYFSRKKEAKKRRRFSEAVDKRMSTISGDWKSISAAGASAAIRASMAVGDRASVLYGSNRPVSTFQLEAGATDDMKELPRPRLTTTDGTTRVSRISFAESVYSRPSLGDTLRPTSAYSRSSRAFLDQPPVPPLPPTALASYNTTTRASAASEDTLDAINEKGAYAFGMTQDHDRDRDDEIGNLEMSPTQTSGPYSLDTDTIRARVSPFVVGEEDARGSIDIDLSRDVLQMPALTLMRMGHSADDSEFISNGQNQTLFTTSPTSPTYGTKASGIQVPSPTHQQSPAYAMPPYSTTGSSPFAGFADATGQSDGTIKMSPDDLLRAYASRSATTPVISHPITGSSPDEMLKAYAARSASNSSSIRSNSRPGTANSSNSSSAATTPIYAALHTNGGTMRTLYAPNMSSSLNPPRSNTLPSNNPYRKSMGVVSEKSSYSDDEDDGDLGRAIGKAN